MKKSKFLVILAGFGLLAAVALAGTVGDDMTFEGPVTFDTDGDGDGFTFPADDGSASQVLQTNGSGTVSWAAAGSATAYDDIGDPDANSSITFAGYTNTWTSTLDTGTVFKIDNTDADLSGDTLLLNLEFTDDGDANGIFARFTDNNGDNVWQVDANGATTITGTAEGTTAFTITGGDAVLTDGDLTLSSGDLAVTGTTTLDATTMDGILTLDNGLTIDNASNNILELNENSEELLITFATNVIDFSSGSGVNQFDFFDGVASSFTKAANGAADDLTISVTGAQDSSLVLSSAGTGADAFQLVTSAGGIDITTTGAAAGEDIDVSTDASVNVTSTENAADSIVISSSNGGVDISAAGAGAGEDIDVTATGSSINLTATENVADSIVLSSSNGGVDITAASAAAGEDIDITATGSSINATATENAADSIVISSSNGGIDITAASAASGEDIDISTTGSSVNISATEVAADAIVINANADGAGIDISAQNDIDIAMTNGAAGEDITISNTGGSTNISATEDIADAIVINATTGGVDITADGAAASDLDLTCTNGSVNVTAGEAAADAFVVSSTGGIDLTSAATYDIDITATGGRILAVASEAAADQFKMDAQGTVAGNAINFETTDGGILFNADGAANGDIQLDSADDMTLTSAGDLTLAVTGTVSAGGSAITNVLDDAENVSAANVITASECGKTFYIGDATEFQSTLPALSGVSAGCWMKFIVTAAPSGADYTVVTGNSLENQIYGVTTVNGSMVQGATEDTITFADSAAGVGDWVLVESNGTSWFVSGQGFAAGAITLTQVD